jgi:hypothetical protein
MYERCTRGVVKVGHSFRRDDVFLAFARRQYLCSVTIIVREDIFPTPVCSSGSVYSDMPQTDIWRYYDQP